MVTMFYKAIFFAFLLLAVSARFAYSPAQDDSSGAVAAAPQFLQMLHDVPLMPGLSEMTERAMVFDKPGGRIGSAAAFSDTLPVQQIRAFYDETLPRLGWRKIAANAFVREQEQLWISVSVENGYQVVNFQLEPL